MSVIICIVAIVVYLVIGAVIAGLVREFDYKEQEIFVYFYWPIYIVGGICIKLGKFVFGMLISILDKISTGVRGLLCR